MRKYVFSILFMFSLSANFAQAIIEVRPAKDTISVGEVLDLELLVSLRRNIPIKGVDVSSFLKPRTLMNAFAESDSLGNFPTPDFDLESNLGGGSFIEKDKLQWLSESNNSKEAKYDFKITFWDSGIFQLNSGSIVFENSYDTSKMVQRPGPIIVVKLPPSLETQDTEPDIMPIKSILKEGKNWEDYKWWVIIPLCLILAILLIIWLVRRKPKEEVVEYIAPKLPAHEIALEKLRALDRNELWQKGEIKAYQSELTYIIREYLENRFDIFALESTTSEIKADLRKTDFNKEHEQQLLEILQVADLVKFAKAKPSGEIHQKFLITAKDFVKSTKQEIINQANEDS